MVTENKDLSLITTFYPPMKSKGKWGREKESKKEEIEQVGVKEKESDFAREKERERERKQEVREKESKTERNKERTKDRTNYYKIQLKQRTNKK